MELKRSPTLEEFEEHFLYLFFLLHSCIDQVRYLLTKLADFRNHVIYNRACAMHKKEQGRHK